MKNATASLLRRAAPLACLLLLAGCLQERLFWSPDGARAAVLTADGLYLTDPAGKLSPLLLPRAYRVAWLGDSRRLVVGHSREIKDFASLATALGPERTQRLTAKAESFWRQLLPLRTLKDLPSSAIKADDDVGGITLYLREKYPAALKEKAGADWKDLEAMAAEWHTLSVARLDGDRLELGAILHAGLARIGEIRPAPGGLAVAFVTSIELSPEPEDSRQILLSPIDGSAPALVVANHTSASPDWSADGRSLWYCTTAGAGPSGNRGDDLRVGTLSSCRALDANGRIAVESQAEAHVSLIFHDRSRVRSLRDGRVVFNAAELHLPVSAKDRDTREGLFVVDPATNTVTRLCPAEPLANLPPSLAGFDLSPDETQILVADGEGRVWLLTLANQKVELISERANREDAVAPAWRGPGEFTYLRKGDSRSELIQRRGASETVISAAWPEAMLQRLVK